MNTIVWSCLAEFIAIDFFAFFSIYTRKDFNTLLSNDSTFHNMTVTAESKSPDFF